MANLCSYKMKVWGTEENVQKFLRAMMWQGEYKENGVGRVYDCDVDECYSEGDEYSAVCYGSCAWSVLTAMRNHECNNLEKLSEQLGLSIEVYAEEGGIGFQEHFCVINGEIQCDECIDWYELDVEEIEECTDDFWKQDWVVASGITKENYMDYAEDGYVHIGGYESWDWEYVR